MEVEQAECKCLKNHVEEEEGFVKGDAELFFGGEGEEAVGNPGDDARPNDGVRVVLDEGYKFGLVSQRLVFLKPRIWFEGVR